MLIRMSDFDDMVQAGASESARLMNDPIDVCGVTVPSVFNEDSMDVQHVRHGEIEDITALAVVSLADLPELPKQHWRVYRHKTKRTYLITSVSTDAGHCELSLTREGRKHGA